MTRNRKRRRPRAGAALLAAAATLLLGGCWTLSLHPLYSDDVVLEPGLEGRWGDPEEPGGETWEFLRDSERSYRLIVREENVTTVDPARDGLFNVRLVRLGGGLYADIFPEAVETVPDFYEAHVIRGHCFARLRLEGDALHASFLDEDWLREGLKSGRFALGHERCRGRIVLTASTEELQAFVAEHGAEGFAEEILLRRSR